MRKNLTVLLLAAALLLSGCSAKKTDPSTPTETPAPTQEVISAATPENTLPPTPEASSQPEQTPIPTPVPVETPIPTPEPTPEVTLFPETGTDLDACKADMVDQLGLTDVVDMSVERMSALYGIDGTTVVRSASFVAASGAAFPMEIVMLEAADETAAAEIQSKLEVRLAAIEEQASSYDPDSTALAQACSVRRDGCFVAMFFSSEHETMDTIYAGYLE